MKNEPPITATATYLTEPEAAKHASFAAITFKKWRHLRCGPPYIKIGRSIRYELAALDRWIAARAVAEAQP